MHTLKKFYELDANTRPNEKDCIFLSSHEPCSMCLSAITFSGFDNFYYFFHILPQMMNLIFHMI
jgi:tRNA(Arg) A34 adenosine deaminase TadA